MSGLITLLMLLCVGCFPVLGLPHTPAFNTAFVALCVIYVVSGNIWMRKAAK